ncbi:unnamed protein product [Strongylus vulgaris]|uniref:Uncharacterized protein n=1 Tax=Strongylus vulgaris TaxID=40348 RepID=A0A3P7JGL6_STRVU|nr:unnamed protein product [Strongylus vulgaris]
MSLVQPSSPANVNEGSGSDRWIEQVEHEETIAPEAVNEEEVEDYVEIDGIVDDHSMQHSVLLPGNTMNPGTLRDGKCSF